MSKVKLYKYQEEAFNNTMEIYKSSDRACVIMATGTGKSYVMMRLLEEFDKVDGKAYILTPNNPTKEQTIEKMVEYGLNNAEFGLYQTINAMTDEEIAKIDCDLIIADELHRTGASQWGKKFEHLINSHPNAKVFGVTATPIRSDGRDMAEEYFDGNKACEISLSDAIVREILPMPLYVSGLYTFEEEYKNMSDKIEKGNNSLEEKAELQKELLTAKQQLEKANGVPEIIKKYITNYNGKYIVFCKNKTHMKKMKGTVKKWFKQADYNGKIFSYEYYSEDKDANENFNNFQNNNQEGLKLLFVIDMLNEGLHLKDINGCILLRTTGSHIVYYQQIGRVIDAGSKEQRVILDLVSNFNSLKSFNLKKELKESVRKRQLGSFTGCSEEFELDKFDIVDCVQECVDVFENIDSHIYNNTLNELLRLWDTYVESGYDDDSIADIDRFRQVKRNWRDNVRIGKASEKNVEILNEHNFPLSYNEEIKQRIRYMVSNYSIEELIEDKRIKTIVTMYKNNSYDNELMDFLGNNENFLSIVSKLYDKEFEHFNEILNLYLNDGNNIKKIKKDTVYKNYELGKKFYTYRYKEKYFEYFEKFGLTVKKYNQKELFMYKIDLLSECIKNNIGTGKGLVYKGENVGEWYRNQRKSFRKGKLSEYCCAPLSLTYN